MHIRYSSYLPHLAAILSLPMIIGGYLLIRYGTDTNRWMEGGLLAATGLLNLTSLIRLLTRPSLGLWLKPDGIYIVTVRYTVHIPWSIIMGIEPAVHRGNDILLVHLSNTEDFIRQHPWWMRWAIRKNIEILSTPFIISLRVYRGTPGEIYHHILSAYYRYR